MFHKNFLKTKKTKEKLIEFDIFKTRQNAVDDDSLLKEGQAKESYNVISENGALTNGYGFCDLVMPCSEEDLTSEYPFLTRGNEIMQMWKLKWYDVQADHNCYYLFFYNDENNVCFDDLFKERTIPFVWPTEFTALPYITNYRYNKQDAIMLSGKDEKLMVIYGNGKAETGTAPAIVSCCNHYGKLFAITAKARGTLVYTDVDIINWDDTLAQNLDFSDGRGDLNKIVSFNDYIYLFRDFGITKLSVYSNAQEFSISHIYKSAGYIHPNTIVEMGDEVYFLEGENLKSFDGRAVKDLPLECLSHLKGQDNRYATAECYEGKYFLACRGAFEGENFGCENAEEGYKNNLLVVYDIANKQVDILRGVDIRQLLALTNHLKSKLVACFYGDHMAKIGQLSKDGKIFGSSMKGVWKSGKMNFDMPGQRKQIKTLMLKSQGDCQIVVRSEEGESICVVRGKEDLQKIQTNLFGKEFEFEISSTNEDGMYISDFVVTVAI